MNLANLSYSTPKSISTSSAGYESTKRIWDFVVASVLCLLFLPLMAAITLVVSLDSPGGAFFVQERVGRNGVRFRLFKFRSMRWDAPNISTAEMQQQTESPVTKVGAFLRRTSLDELPQLVNVFKGEMSLVGPRPALPAQTHLNELRARGGVDTLLPGITGWAQINGRDELSDELKVAHDVYYKHHRSLKLDLHILVRTVTPVLTGRGNR
ncbi:MAG: sugar transferase [Akkermansiaceae bacterium]|nr:sugar transferase [Armatimonadota bacterium]